MKIDKDILLEELYHKINYYKSQLDDDFYDEVDRRANANKIAILEARIEELREIIELINND